MRRQAVFEIEDADQLGLFQQRQAKKRPCLLAAYVFISGKRVTPARVIQDHLALSADDLLKDPHGQLRRRHRRSEKTDPDAIATARRSRLDPVSAAARKNQEAAVGPGMLDGNHHQRLDQLLEHDFAGHSLRHLDNRGEIELLSARLNLQSMDYCFYHSLAIAAVVQASSPERQAELREDLIAHLASFQRWAESCPATFAHKHSLVSAEWARLEGREIEAMQLYEQAIRSAAERGFLQDRALAG